MTNSKIIQQSLFSLSCLLFAFSMASAQENSPQQITMCTEHWPPFVIVEEGKSITQGSWIVLLHEIFNDLPGYSLKIKSVPWKRCLLLIEAGKIDGTFSLFKKPERLAYMNFTMPVVLDRSVIWYSSINFKTPLSWSRFQDLAQYKIGVIRGENFNKEIDQLISSQQIKTFHVTNDVQNFKKLALGRIDIIVKNERVGWALVNELQLNSSVKAAFKPAYLKKRYLSFTKQKDYHQLINMINIKVKEMQAKGEIRKILGYKPIKKESEAQGI